MKQKRKEIHLRHAKKGKNIVKKLSRLLGELPLLKKKATFELKEIAQLLKMIIHGKNA